MEAQKKEARSSWKGSGDDTAQKIWFDLAKKNKLTEFEGYDKSSTSSIIKAILNGSEELKIADKTSKEYALIVENTSLRWSGGQVGDKGIIFNENFNFEV